MTNHHGQNVLHIAAENGAAGNLQLLVDAVQELRCDEKLDGKCKVGASCSAGKFVISYYQRIKPHRTV